MRTSDPYTLEITPSAQRDMNRLDLPIARRVAAALRELALDSRTHGCTKMRALMTCGESSLASGVPSTESTTTSSLRSWFASGIAARCNASPGVRGLRQCVSFNGAWRSAKWTSCVCLYV